MYNTDDYRNAPSGIGPLSAEWKDKPHRLIYDLCREIERPTYIVVFYYGSCDACNCMVTKDYDKALRYVTENYIDKNKDLGFHPSDHIIKDYGEKCINAWQGRAGNRIVIEEWKNPIGNS